MGLSAMLIEWRKSHDLNTNARFSGRVPLRRSRRCRPRRLRGHRARRRPPASACHASTPSHRNVACRSIELRRLAHRLARRRIKAHTAQGRETGMDGTRESGRLRRSLDQRGTQDARFFLHGVAMLRRPHAQTSFDAVFEVVNRDAGRRLSPPTRGYTMVASRSTLSRWTHRFPTGTDNPRLTL